MEIQVVDIDIWGVEYGGAFSKRVPRRFCLHYHKRMDVAQTNLRNQSFGLFNLLVSN